MCLQQEAHLILQEQMVKLNALSQRYCFVFGRATRRISRIYNRHLTKVSLTVGQYGALTAIAHSGPTILRDLAEELVIERSAMLRAVRPLISAGLLSSAPDPPHRKRLLYQLTDEGRDCLRSAAKSVHDAEREIEARFQHAHIERIRDALLPVADGSRPAAISSL